MPLYEYHCDSCNKSFSKIRKIKDRETEVECPACSKLSGYSPTFSTQPPILKGDGFHATTYGVKEGKGRV
jgi:putative FmdB family regulatory protein